MRFDFSDGLSESVLAKVRKHSAGTEAQRTRVLLCHYCNHKAIVVFEDSWGHVKAKCKKCNKESIYNVVLRKNGTVMFRRVTG
jgi:DNA-directed RNA polymerase subunit RPC12/RpoP